MSEQEQKPKRSRVGRPPGALNVKTQAIARKCAETGMTPLEVMVEAMHEAYLAGSFKDAANYAAMAAPYIHPRLSAVDSKTRVEGTMQIQLVDEFPEEEPIA